MPASQIEKVTAEQTGAVLRTERLAYNVFSIEFGQHRFAVWDLAGENFQEIATKQDLWKFMALVIPKCSGIMLNVSLCTLWYDWNTHITLPRSSDGAPANTEATNKLGNAQAESTKARLPRKTLTDNIDAYLWFLRYAFAAHGQSRGWRPTTDISAALNDEDGINKALHLAPKFPHPVFVNLSMADLYYKLKSPEMGGRDGHGPYPATEIDASRHDPNVVGYYYLSSIFELLNDRARSFRFGFTSAGSEPSDRLDLRVSERVVEAFEFVTGADWSVPGLPASFYYWLRRRGAAWKKASSNFIGSRS
jgi:hypothetical protein